MPNLCFLNLHAEVNYGYSNSQKGSRMVVGGCIPPYFPGFNLFHLCIFWRCTSTYFYISPFRCNRSPFRFNRSLWILEFLWWLGLGAHGSRRVFKGQWRPVKPSWRGWEKMRVSKRKILQRLLRGCGPSFSPRCLKQPWNHLVAAHQERMCRSLCLGFWNSKG